MKNQMSATKKKLIFKKIEEISQEGLWRQRDVIISGFWTTEGQGYEVLCFVGSDLVFYKELTPPTQVPGFHDFPYFDSSDKIFTLTGINDEVDYILLHYLEYRYFYDMKKFESDYGQDSKFVHYIKKNFYYIFNK